MRTKRVQKRRARAQAESPARAPLRELPDPFSAENAELVAREHEDHEAALYDCPCCVDRRAEFELSAYEQWYLENAASLPRQEEA